MHALYLALRYMLYYRVRSASLVSAGVLLAGLAWYVVRFDVLL